MANATHLEEQTSELYEWLQTYKPVAPPSPVQNRLLQKYVKRLLDRVFKLRNRFLQDRLARIHHIISYFENPLDDIGDKCIDQVMKRHPMDSMETARSILGEVIS